MTDIEFLNFVTPIISAHLAQCGQDMSAVKFPNTDLPSEHLNNFVEILFTPYIGRKIVLSGSKRMFGCITFRIISERGIGLGDQLSKATLFAECLSKKILNGIVFEEHEVKVLDHTLSQTQTTTGIPYSQVNVNIDYSYTR